MARCSFLLRFILSACFLMQIISPQAEAQNPTPNFWQCENRIGGAWNFGTAPYACDVSPFGDPAIQGAMYEPALLDDAKSRSEERPRYMQELQPILRDLALIYLKRRKPSVSDDELNAWVRAWYTIAHQESFWSHYRIGNDSQLKMMRGDFGHGHGLLQVDDRWHFAAVRDGVAADLVSHTFYAMDEYYAAWQRAPSQSCVSSATNWEARTRSAWSAYNGGPSRICRWTNPNSPHASKDRQFIEKYNLQTWRNYIADFNREASIDVECIADGNSSCDGGGEVDRPEQGFLYAYNGGACTFDGAAFQCVENLRDSACLMASYSLVDSNVYNLDPRFLEGATINQLDRHATCVGAGIEIYSVGSVAVFGKNINMRSTPGGERILTVPRTTPLQILDYEIRAEADFPRYYKVEYNGEQGYVYAGDLNSAPEWLELTGSREIATEHIVLPGHSGEIRARSGINLRATPGGRKLTAVSYQRSFTILSLHIQGEENEVFYEIDTGRDRGYVYGGRVIPSVTTQDWLVPSGNN